MLLGQDPASLIGSYRGRLDVLGTGRTLWEDLKQIENEGQDLMAVNMAGVLVPFAFTHWASIHGDSPLYQPKLMKLNQMKPQVYKVTLHTYYQPQEEKEVVNWHHAFPVKICKGSSGLFAALVAIKLGYTDIRLLGMPMDKNGHFYDAPDYQDLSHGFEPALIIKEWAKHMGMLEGKVTAISGPLVDLLGHPNDL